MKWLVFLALLFGLASAGINNPGTGGGVESGSNIVNPGASASFFVNASTGNDSNVGSQASPWQTLHKVNNSVLGSGTTINLQGSFSGGDNGLIITTTVAPSGGITITSYGAGATITSGNLTACVTVTNVPTVTISNLTCAGGGNASNTTNGILVVNNQAGNTKLAGPTISGNTVSGYGVNGIWVEGNNGTSGWTGTTISNNTVHDSTGNGGIGTTCIKISSTTGNGYGTPSTSNTATVSGNTAYNCTGQAGLANWSGSGIVVGSITNATLSNNIVHDSGGNNQSAAGPVGIWTYDSVNVTIQFNEVYNMADGVGGGDSDGYDCDGGASGCLIQYNYAHDNFGACILMFAYNDGTVTTWNNNTARFNVCQNNATGGNDAEIRAGTDGGATPITNMQIYNNTAWTGITGLALKLGGGTLTSGNVANNIFYGQVLKTILNAASGATGIAINGNDYYGSAKFTYNGSSYTTYASFVAGSSQETVNGGFTSNPQIFGPGQGGTIGGYVPSSLTAYKVLTGSPMLPNAGINLNSQFSISPGSQDYYGTAVTASTLPVGASAASTAAVYAGPGNVVSGALVFFSCARAYTAIAATSNFPGCQITRASDSHFCDVLFSGANTGAWAKTVSCDLLANDGETPAQFCNATTCTVSKMYDQAGLTANVTQGTAAHQPALLQTCTGSIPCANFTSTAMLLQGTLTGTVTDGTFIGTVSCNTTTNTQEALWTEIQSAAANDFKSFYALANGSNCVAKQGSGGLGGIISDGNLTSGTLYSIQAVFNGASSALVVNNTATTGTITNTAVTNPPMFIGQDEYAEGTNAGYVAEIGFWNGVHFTSTQYGNMCHNQSAYYGLGLSC